MLVTTVPLVELGKLRQMPNSLQAPVEHANTKVWISSTHLLICTGQAFGLKMTRHACDRAEWGTRGCGGDHQ